MNRARGIIAICLAVAPIPVHAQLKGAPYCAPQIYNDNPNQDANSISRMHPLVSRARYATFVEGEQWKDAMLAVREDAAASFDAAHVADADRNKFYAEIDSVIDVLPGLPKASDPLRAKYVDSLVKPIRFNPIPSVEAYTLFRRQNQIAVGDLAADPARALCWSAMSADLILFRLSKPLEGATIARLARLTRSWSNYRTYGYTRQPLELLLWRGSVRDSLPPSTQWIFGHLSAGGELHGWSMDSLRANTTAVIEFGGLRYRSNYTQYMGASLIVALASGRPAGAGVMLHIARGLRGGAVFRNEGKATTTSVLLSTDLYGLLERSKKSVDDGLAIARGMSLLPKRP